MSCPFLLGPGTTDEHLLGLGHFGSAPVTSGITSIRIRNSPVPITIARPDGTQIDCPPNSPLNAGSFGVKASGRPYFNTAGATPGEAGTLGWDGARQRLRLVTGSVADEHVFGLAQQERNCASRELPRTTHPVQAGTLDAVQQERQRARETLPFMPQPVIEGMLDPKQQARQLAWERRGA